MSGNIMDEFLVLLGWKVDTSAARKAEQTADRVADTVEAAEKRQTDASVAGAAKRKVEADREAGRRTKGAAAYIDELKKREAAEKKATASTEQANKKAAKVSETSAATVAKSAAAIITAVEGAAVGVTLAVTRIASRMEELYYASERTHSSVAKIKAYEYAASQLGSTADGAANSLETLAKNLRSSPGYEGMLKNLGVATRQNGKLRDLTDITVDLGKALGKMPHFQALAFANALGLDERTLLALKTGEFAKHVRDYQEMLGKAGLNSEQAARDSAAFMNTWRRMWAAVDILFNRIGAALTAKFGGQISRLTDFLLTNADRIAAAVIGIGETLLRLATRIVDIIQKFNDADPATKQFIIQMGVLAGALLLLNSGPVAALLALGSAIVVLYDDYQKWREGSKDTLIDWDRWAPAIEKTLSALKALWEGFDRVAHAITGQSGLVVALEALAVVMVAKLLTPLGRVVGLLGTLGAMTPPAWLLRLLGLGGVAVAGAAIANENGILDAGAGSRSWHEAIVRTLDPGIANRVYGQTETGKAADAKDNRTLLQRILPQSMGGRQAPASPKASLESGARESYDFWRSKGLNHEQAAGLVGMEQGESDFNPRAVGDGGLAHGAFQHHPDRRAAILRGTGIDIGSATHQQQLEGAYWEFQNTHKKAWAAVQAATNPSEAAAAGVRHFEIPRDISGESKLRGGYAEGWGRRFAPSDSTATSTSVTDISNRASYSNGKLDAVKGFVVHHTGGRGTPDGVVDTLNRRGLGVQYVMDRDGKIFQTLPDGARGAHLRPAQNGSGLSNANALGMEVIANDDRDINSKQIASATAFIAELQKKYPGLQVFGHGELNAHKQESEGRTIVDAFRNGGAGQQVSAAVEKVRSVALDTAGKVEDTLTAYPKAWMDQAQTGMDRMGSRFDAVDSWKNGKPFAATPLGINHNNSRSVSNTFHEGDRHITVQGVSDPKEAADHVTKSDTRRRSDLIGNFQNSFA